MTDTKAFEFDIREDRNPDTLTEHELVFQALGAASTCWEQRPSGVFDGEQASDIGNALLYELGLPGDKFRLDELSDADRAALQRFTEPNFAVRDERQREVERFRRLFYRAALGILLAAPPTKSRAVALTELETAMMWAVKAYFGAPGE